MARTTVASFLIEVEGGIFDIRRTGKIAGHRIQKRLHPFVLVGRSDENGGQFPRQRSPADGFDNQRIGNRFLLQDRLHQFIGEHGGGLDHLFPFLPGLGQQFRRDLFNPDTFAVVPLEIDRLHGQQIDHPLEIRFQADRDLQGDGVVAQFGAELADHPRGIGAASVAFVDEGDAGNLVALHLQIDGDGLRLDAAHGAEDQNGAVEDPKGSFHFDRKIHVAGGIDDIDLMVEPFTEGGRRGDGDAALLFQFHGVHGGADAVFALDVVNGVDSLRVKEYPLGQGGFPRIDMGADSDIPYIFNLFFIPLPSAAERPGGHSALEK